MRSLGLGLLAILAASIPLAAGAAPPTVTTDAVADAPRSVAELKAMQERIRAVSTKLLSRTVAIRVGSAFGSGVVVSPDGYVATAAHVIGGPGQTAEVRLSDGRLVKGKTLGVNRTADAGLIKIANATSWDFAPLAKSADLKPGQWCLATGHPGGYEQGRGPVLRLGRVLTCHDDFLSSDCPLIGGDSGGPLFDLDGNVIAVHSRIADPLTANIHVPADRFQDSWDRLARGDAWGLLPGTMPFVGVQGDPDRDDAFIAQVVPGSPAERAGVRPGDLVVRFGEHPIDSFRALVELVRSREPGDRVVMEVERGNTKQQLTIVIGLRSE
jgi:serine protease Do